MRSALLALPTVRDTYLQVGDIAVDRSSRELEGTYRWAVVFTQENPASHANLVAIGTQLVPKQLGAGVRASLVRLGGQHAVLSLTAMESVGVVRQSGLSSRWIPGTSARGDVRTDGFAASELVSSSLRGRFSGQDQLRDTLGSSDGQPSLVIRGSVANVDRALRAMKYRNSKYWNGPVVVRVTIDDLGNTGLGGPQVVSQSFPLRVVAVNNAPVLTRPQSEPVIGFEDQEIVITDISVNDIDSAPSVLALLVNVTHGSLSMGFYSPLMSSDNHTARMVGTVADLNGALHSLRYIGDPDYNGHDVLQITVWDNGNTADVPVALLTDGGTFSVDITNRSVSGPLIPPVQVQDVPELVQDRGVGYVVSNTIEMYIHPVNDKPYVRMDEPLQTVPEDVDLVLQQVWLDDVDANEYLNNDRLMYVKIWAVNGTVRFAGSVAGLTVNTTAAVNPQYLQPDSGPGFGGNEAGTVNITAIGTLANLNAALQTLVFRSFANYNGPATVTIYVDDRGNTGPPYPRNDTNTQHIIVTPINDPPVLHTTQQLYPILEDTEREIFLAVTDDDTRVSIGVQSGLLTPLYVEQHDLYNDSFPDEWNTFVNVSIVVDHGVVSLPLLNENVTLLYGSGFKDKAVVITGSIADVNIALSKTIYRPNLNWNSQHDNQGYDVITVQSDDAGLVLPVVNVPHADFERSLQSTIVPTSGIQGYLPSPCIMRLTVDVIPVNDAPVLDMPGSVYDPVYRVGDNLTPLIRGFNVFPVVEDVDTIVKVTLRDVDAPDSGFGFTNGKEDGLVEVNITSDHGTVTLGGGDRNVIGGGRKAPVQEFVVGTGFRDRFVSFRASVAVANSLLNTLVYCTVPHYYGPDLLTVIVSDLGNTGTLKEGEDNTGSNATSAVVLPYAPVNHEKETTQSVTRPGAPRFPLRDSLSMPIYVAAVNDPPISTVPTSLLFAYEDSWLQIPDPGFFVSDVDAGGEDGKGAGVTIDGFGNLTVTVSVGYGVFTLSLLMYNNLTFLVGDGVEDRVMTFVGAIPAINAALRNSQFRSAHNWNSLRSSPDFITMLVNDTGSYGADGPLTDAKTAWVHVLPVNDHPVIVVPNQTLAYFETVRWCCSWPSAVSACDVVACGCLWLWCRSTTASWTCSRNTHLRMSSTFWAGAAPIAPPSLCPTWTLPRQTATWK